MVEFVCFVVEFCVVDCGLFLCVDYCEDVVEGKIGFLIECD